MLRGKWFIAGLLAAICASALAIDSAGLPSRPTFLSAIIKGTLSAQGGINSTGTLTANAPTGPSISATSGTAASVANPAVQVINNRIVSFLDSNNLATLGAFLYYDGSNNLNIGTLNGSSLLLMHNGLWATGVTGGDEGVGTANFTGLFVGGNAVCQSTGTNCPATVTQTTTTATGTATGCTAGLTTTFRYVKTGNAVTFSIDTFSCTSNATTFTFTGAVPAGMQPARDQYSDILCFDNGGNPAPCRVRFQSGSTTATMFFGSTSGGAWTASAGKGIQDSPTGSYITN